MSNARNDQYSLNALGSQSFERHLNQAYLWKSVRLSTSVYCITFEGQTRVLWVKNRRQQKGKGEEVSNTQNSLVIWIVGSINWERQMMLNAVIGS